MINPSSSCFHQILVISHSWPTQARFVSDLSFTDAERPRKGEQEHFTRTRPWPLSKTRKKEKKKNLYFTFPSSARVFFIFIGSALTFSFMVNASQHERWQMIPFFFKWGSEHLRTPPDCSLHSGIKRKITALIAAVTMFWKRSAIQAT